MFTDMQRPKCPCWGCDNRTATCKSECELFKQYEADYKVFDKQRREERQKKDAVAYKPHKKEMYYRDILMCQKIGKKR